MQSTLYTIGHSNRKVSVFLQQLKDNGIQVVVDIRSAPYSRYVPQFNKKEIESVLVNAGLKYIYMGDAIGGKPSDPQFTDADSRVMYDKIAEAETFQQGLDRLAKGLEDGWTIALMCAEEDPYKCHRHLLIGRELELKRNIPVLHIRSDNTSIRAKKIFLESAGQMKLF